MAGERFWYKVHHSLPSVGPAMYVVTRTHDTLKPVTAKREEYLSHSAHSLALGSRARDSLDETMTPQPSPILLGPTAGKPRGHDEDVETDADEPSRYDN